MVRIVLLGCLAWIGWHVWESRASAEELIMLMAIPLAAMATLTFLRD